MDGVGKEAMGCLRWGKWGEEWRRPGAQHAARHWPGSRSWECLWQHPLGLGVTSWGLRPACPHTE